MNKNRFFVLLFPRQHILVDMNGEMKEVGRAVIASIAEASGDNVRVYVKDDECTFLRSQFSCVPPDSGFAADVDGLNAALTEWGSDVTDWKAVVFSIDTNAGDRDIPVCRLRLRAHGGDATTYSYSVADDGTPLPLGISSTL